MMDLVEIKDLSGTYNFYRMKSNTWPRLMNSKMSNFDFSQSSRPSVISQKARLVVVENLRCRQIMNAAQAGHTVIAV